MKPCPFCGVHKSEQLIVQVYTLCQHGPLISFCECQNCGAVGPTHRGGDSEESAREGAIYLWGQRIGVETQELKNVEDTA